MKERSSHYLESELLHRLRETPEIFEFLQQSSLDGLWYWDLESPEHEWMSDQFWLTLGCDPSERQHLSSEWKDLIYPEDLQTALRNFQAHCADPNYPYDQIVRYKHADGSTVWVRCRGVAIRDASGKPVRMLGAHNDVTPFKQAELQLQRQAEERSLLNTLIRQIRQSLQIDQILHSCVCGTRQLLQVDRVLICRTEPNGNARVVAEDFSPGSPSILEQINLQGCCFFDGERLYQQGEIEVVEDVSDSTLSSCYASFLDGIGVKAYIAIPIPRGEIQWGTLIVQNYRASRSWHFRELSLLHSLAEQLSVAVQHAEIHHHVEQLVEERTAELTQALKFQSLLQKITNRLLNSLDEDQIIRDIVDGLGAALDVYCCDIGFYDLEHSITKIQYEYNKAMTPAIGHVISMHEFPHIYPQLLRKQHVQICWPALRERWHDLTDPRQHLDGERLESLTCPIWDEQGVLGDIWLFRSVNRAFSSIEIDLVKQLANQCAIALRQSRLYQASQKQVQELERLNQMKEEFVATVSHELRTPLASLRMALKLMDTATTEEKQQQYHTLATQECEREIRLVNDLLSLQQLTSGQCELQYQPLDLLEWIKPLCIPFEERALTQGQRFRICGPASMQTLYTDPSHLERVIRELLHNACKYTPEGGEISLELGLNGDRLEIEISNTGELEEEELTKIFERFYRISQVDRWKHGGTGLGLALVKELVEHMRGSINASSQNGWIQFRVSLPVQVD